MADDVQNDNAPSEPHIRTYATDVAKLTGKALPHDIRNEPAPKKPETAKPPLERPEPPPARIIPRAPTTGESRAQVLERLQRRKETTPPPTPAPAAFMPIPRAQTTNETKEQVLERLKRAASAPAPAPIHTYKTDFADETKAKGASRISMVAAEQDAPTRAPEVVKRQSRTGVFAVVGGVILVLFGAGAVFLAYRFVTSGPAIPTETFIPSLIFADERIALSGSGEELRQGLITAGASTLRDGDVALVYMMYSTTTSEGVTEERVVSGNVLFEALRLPAPNILTRNVEPESTLGTIHAGGEIRPFFILKVASYERTFAGMLSWEGTMERDLRELYPVHPEPVVAPPPSTGTSTVTSTPATTTPALPEPALPRLSFVDEVVENHDVRVLRDGLGRTVMLYGYRDKETLIIARSEVAFSELLERLASSR